MNPREILRNFYSVINEKGKISEENFEKAALMLNVRKHLKNYYKVYCKNFKHML